MGWQKGISLPEMLVVLIILSASISLVAPLTIERLEKNEIKFEKKELYLLFKRLQKHAKWTGAAVEVKAQQHNLQVYSNGEPLQAKRFEKLLFDEQSLIINAKGYPERCTIKIKEPKESLEVVFSECTTKN